VNKHDGVYARGPKSWRVVVSAGLDPISGKYVAIRETVRGTKTEAKRRRDELRTQVAKGTAASPDRERVDLFLERYISHQESLSKIRPKTAAVYRGYLRREVTPRIGTMRVAAVRPLHLQRVLDEALESGLSGTSVLQIHRILHAALKQAVRWQLIAVNPADGVTPPKIRAPKLSTPCPTEVAKILAGVEGRFRAPLALLAATGMRRGEVLGLRWEDVNLDASHPSLRVAGTLQRAEGDLRLFEPKTARGRRSIPLPASIVPVLRGVRASQTERRLIAGPGWSDGDYVFDRGDGRPIDPDTLGKGFRKAREKAGMDSVRLHDLRHAWATMQMSAGTNPRIVSDILGHAQVAFTMQVYSHPDLAMAESAMATVDAALGGAIGDE
jgi:integrase